MGDIPGAVVGRDNCLMSFGKGAVAGREIRWPSLAKNRICEGWSLAAGFAGGATAADEGAFGNALEVSGEPEVKL